MRSYNFEQRFAKCLFLIVLACGSMAILPCSSGATGVYLDFNDFPVTTGSVPGNSPNWEYSSRITNDYGYGDSASSGWKSKTKLADGWNWFSNHNRSGACYDHMYGDTYGFLDITSSGHSGNALRNVITGGLAVNSTNAPCKSPLGTPLYSREAYTGLSQVYTGGKVGHSYIYFRKIDVIGSSRDTSPFTSSSGGNRLSAYIYLPADTNNGQGGWNKAVQATYQLGLFRDPTSTGYHHYINTYIQGGGWAKIQVEETTNGDNGGDGTTRYIPNFLQTVWQFYFTTLPYSGIAIPPYEVKIDDIEFTADTYTPQNNETISNIAIMYKDSSNTWEVSLNDKYKNNGGAFSTYELRYSFSPITNENWNSATPVTIIADSRFSILARTDGKFQKWWPYYQGVWAPFSLSTADTNALTAGKTVYFAIKDVSQLNNSTTPNDGLGAWGARQGGRPYDTTPATFNYTTDGPALPYIKRISYAITTNLPPKAPKNLSVKP